MRRAELAGIAAAAGMLLAARAAGAVTLEPHAEVARGAAIDAVEVRGRGGAWESTAWDGLARTARAPGETAVRFRVDGGRGGAAVQIPPCAGRTHVRVDGSETPSPPGPVVARVGPGAHEIVVELKVSGYERRIACGEKPRVGAVTQTREGLGVMEFDSPYADRGGGRAVVYVPPGHDLARPAAVLVGLHPWNGTMWTYASYGQLLGPAATRDVVLLLPSGLGNSLYTADAEDEAMRALDALGEVVAVDPRRVSLWGASMGGAGATTVGFHRPDRFAFVASFFGDSKYDVTTYVRALLPDDAAAHTVNALDVVENAAALPVLLVHGERDATSPIRQSEMLDEAMRARGMHVRFVRAPGVGHAGKLVEQHIAAIVDEAARAVAETAPKRVAYRSVRPWDTGAYGVHLVRRSDRGDAVVTVEARDDGVHLTRAEGVRAIVIDPGAMGTPVAPAPPLVLDGVRGVDVRWAQRSP
jgi:pimeloyl-ACP methyl ester carboxylesterase